MAVRGMGQGDIQRHRIETAFWLILLLYLALVGRLLYLQGALGPALRRSATEQREQKIRLPAHRGTISDRAGRPLAVSLYSGTVGFDPAIFHLDTRDPKRAAQQERALTLGVARAAAVLNLPVEQINQQIARENAHFNLTHPRRFVALKRDVPMEVAQRIRDGRLKMPGFGVQDGDKRLYASGQNAAQVIGFLAPDGTGSAGVERGCRRWLDGHPGFAITEVDDHQREIPDTLHQMLPAKDGLDVHTTLDATAQQIVTEEAQRVYHRFHPVGVSVVVLDPATGDVLALSSMPTFDPNPKKRATVKGEALAERCAARLYEPGSTLKALTVAAALDQGIITTHSGFYCSGKLKVANRTLHCVLEGPSERYGHGFEEPVDILRHSCNVGAAEIGLKMGPHRLFDADQRFGLFEKLDFGLPNARGRLSFDRNEKVYSAAKVARVAFGHSITTTPLHVALAYAAIANGGVLMKPRLIRTLVDSSGKTVQMLKPQPERRVLSRETSAAVSGMLRAVVSDGTGKIAAIPGYQIAGKTGTAKKYKPGAYVASFVGYAPASPQATPRVVVLVAVDEPHGAYYGADVAAPAFRAILQRLLDYWHTPQDDPESVQARTAYRNLHPTGPMPLLAAAPGARP